MAPIYVACEWDSEHDYFNCNIQGKGKFAPIKSMAFIMGNSYINVHGSARVYVEDQYCFLTDRPTLLCGKNLSEVINAEDYVSGEIIERYGYTEDDRRHYLSYEQL